MAEQSTRSIGAQTFTALLLIAIGSGIQVAAPQVAVSCPARTNAAPDCRLRWWVAFGILPVRNTPLPAMQSVDEVEKTSGRTGNLVRNGRGSSRTSASTPTFSVHLRSGAGRTRAVLAGDEGALQTFREQIVNYLANEHAPPLNATIKPWWPVAWFGNIWIGLGLIQAAMILRRFKT
jgi:hypothetical protein